MSATPQPRPISTDDRPVLIDQVLSMRRMLTRSSRHPVERELAMSWTGATENDFRGLYPLCTQRVPRTQGYRPVFGITRRHWADGRFGVFALVGRRFR